MVIHAYTEYTLLFNQECKAKRKYIEKRTAESLTTWRKAIEAKDTFLDKCTT